jgi:hypothetical protein
VQQLTRHPWHSRNATGLACSIWSAGIQPDNHQQQAGWLTAPAPPPPRSVHVWEDPASFRPERWLAKDAAYSGSGARRFLPFSDGIKNCLGQVGGASGGLLLTDFSADVQLSHQLRGAGHSAALCRLPDPGLQPGRISWWHLSAHRPHSSPSAAGLGALTVPPAPHAASPDLASLPLFPAPAQALGLMEVRTTLATLLGRFWFELSPSMAGEAAVKRSMQMALTLKIKGGLRLLCKPHV